MDRTLQLNFWFQLWTWKNYVLRSWGSEDSKMSSELTRELHWFLLTIHCWKIFTLFVFTVLAGVSPSANLANSWSLATAKRGGWGLAEWLLGVYKDAEESAGWRSSPAMFDGRSKESFAGCCVARAVSPRTHAKAVWVDRTSSSLSSTF